MVFADTAYWIAVFRPTDPWAEAARAARLRLGRIRLLTLDEVLAEFLAALSAGGPLVPVSCGDVNATASRASARHCRAPNPRKDSSKDSTSTSGAATRITA